MVEFALGFLLFLGLIFATFDLGGAVWSYSSVTHAAKQAVRFATIHGAQNPVYDSNGDNVTDEKIKEIAKKNAPGLDPDELIVNVTWSPDNSRGSNVKVRVAYDHNFLVGEFLGLANLVTVARESTMLVIN
jgi:Flp pilus assembly protein TadG